MKIETQPIDVGKTKVADLEKLMDEAIKAKNKTEIKRIDAILYGP